MKVSSNNSVAGRANPMNKAYGNHQSPQFADYQPRRMAKTLIIRNVKKASINKLHGFYKTCFTGISDALEAIISQKTPSLPMNQLYCYVETLCSKGEGETLYLNLRTKCRSHLADRASIISKIPSRSGDIETLREIVRVWHIWEKTSVC
jgi:cullin-4